MATRTPWAGCKAYTVRHLRCDLHERCVARALLRHMTVEAVINEALAAGLAALEANAERGAA